MKRERKEPRGGRKRATTEEEELRKVEEQPIGKEEQKELRRAVE